MWDWDYVGKQDQKTKQASNKQQQQGTGNRELLRARGGSQTEFWVPTPFRQIGRFLRLDNVLSHSHTPGDPTRGSADKKIVVVVVVVVVLVIIPLTIPLTIPPTIPYFQSAFHILP